MTQTARLVGNQAKRSLTLGLLLALSNWVSAAPSVTLTSPGETWRYNAPAATVPLRATASAEAGASIARVEFLVDGNVVASDTSTAYAWNWSNVPAGNYTLIARATDSLGQSSETPPQTLVVSPDNQPPKVSLTVPANNATYALPAAIPLTASASDIERNGKVAKVEFYANGALVATLTQAPWTTPWNDPPAGTYTLIARATDNLGAQTDSLPRTLTVNADNSGPKVSLTSPANKSIYVLPADILLSASASDLEKNGGIARVDFLANGALVGSATASPYRYTWSNPAAGTYTLIARATDKQGTSTDSLPRTLTLVDANDVPKVSLGSPANNARYLTPAQIAMTVSASDIDTNTPISQVEILADGQVLATLTQKPYTWTWANTPVGTHSLSARATDSRGVSNTSVARTVIVSDTNLPPTVSLSAPANNTTVPVHTDVLISANANAPEANDSIVKVEFYQGATLIGTATEKPYQITWANIPSGTHTLTAKATDGQGASTTSAVRKLTVPANQLPGITLSSPTDGQQFDAPASITLSATAADTDGSIARVEFYQGSTLIGSSTTAPYNFVWNNISEGNYSLSAKAIDNNGGESQSAAVAITVNVTGTRVYYLHSDHLNTPRLVTDEQNRVVWRNQPLSEPFGNAPPEEDPDGNGQNFTLNLRFPGQYFDKETNTHYNYYRDYDPETGRYVQSDPIGLQGGINTYGYVEGDPLSYTDPYGLNPGTAAGAAAGTVLLPGPGTVVGAVVGTAIGVGIGWWLTESRSKGEGDEARPPDVNPGKDCDGNCKPCPPNPPSFDHPGDAHGTDRGYHTHQWQYHQAPDCTCRARKVTW